MHVLPEGNKRRYTPVYYQQVILDGWVSGPLGYSLYCFACLHFPIFVTVMHAYVFNKNTMRNMNIKKYKNVRKPNTDNRASKKGWDNEG